MKLECTKESLIKAINKTEKVVSKSISLPVLKNTIFLLEKNTLHIKTTNLDLGIDIKIIVKGQRDGVVAVPGSTLLSFLNSNKDKQVNLETHNGSLMASTSGSSALIKACPHEDFPELPLFSEGISFEIKRQDFLNGLKSVFFAASSSNIKPELSSVYVRSEDGMLIFVATDSFRLSEKKVFLKNMKDNFSFLLPIKNALEIMKIFEDVEENISISVAKNQIFLTAEGIYLTSRIVEGVFPDYRQIIPKSSSTEVVALKEDVFGSIKTASLFSDKFGQVRLVINPKNKTCEFQAKNADLGEGTQTFKAEINGESLEIGFNYKYIQESLQAIFSDSISLSLGGASKPMLIKGVGDQTFLYLVMPMNR